MTRIARSTGPSRPSRRYCTAAVGISSSTARTDPRAMATSAFVAWSPTARPYGGAAALPRHGGSGSRWCRAPVELVDDVRRVLAHPAHGVRVEHVLELL